MKNSRVYPIQLQREALIGPDQPERIHALAKRILAEIGLEVLDSAHREKLASAGLKFRGSRLLLEPGLVDEQVEVMRGLIRSWGAGEEKAGSAEARLTMSVSSYALNVQDLDGAGVVPMTTPYLIESTKLIDSLAGDGVFGAPPGIPTEVHPDLQPLAQYRIAATYARQGASPVDPTAPHTARFLMEMAEVMGHPMRGLPVYIPTPLRLGGESLAVVMACLDRLDHISVSSMPATGLSAPVQPFGALGLAAAEVIGGMIAVKLLTGKPVTCAANIFPGDLREGSMVFGSPENMLFQMLCSDVNRFYGWPAESGPGNYHVMAKSANGQSAAEKAAIMMLGAGLGARHFSCAGTLSLDEIFSAEQLLLDCEIRDWVQRAVRGLNPGEDECEDWLVEIRRGVEGNFMNLDSTLDYYQEHTWYPRRFTRKAIGPWLEEGQPQLSERLRSEARQRIARHDFELAVHQKREIERVYAAAEKTILGT
jgi:trimethylamine:corrinoid methyltransferase-like protein